MKVEDNRSSQRDKKIKELEKEIKQHTEDYAKIPSLIIFKKGKLEGLQESQAFNKTGKKNG